MFRFLKYLQPTSYFSIKRENQGYIFPKEELQIQEDNRYRSNLAKQYDAAWQAIHKGYLGEAETYTVKQEVPVYDEYVFIRKNFSTFWVFYVLIVRLLSLKNPFNEMYCWLKTSKVKRAKLFENPIKQEGYGDFESSLVKEQQKVTVVIPTLNRYKYLKDVLKDFEQQDYKNFEIIVVDQSEPLNEAFYKEFNLDIKLVPQKEKALWLARNTAVKNASGELIALSEDDVRINSDWISQHLKCLDFFKADISAGVFYPEGKSIPKESSYFKVASQFATGNAMLYKHVFKSIGLFDRQFEKQRMGDGEFGMRAYLNGFKSVSNPLASCIDVKAEVGGLREMGSWDAFRTSKLFAPRPIPSVLYFFRRYFGNSASRKALLRTVPMSIMPYAFKKNKPMLIVGALVSILILPLVIFQVIKSWRLATKKLNEGPLIESLS